MASNVIPTADSSGAPAQRVPRVGSDRRFRVPRLRQIQEREPTTVYSALLAIEKSGAFSEAALALLAADRSPRSLGEGRRPGAPLQYSPKPLRQPF
jgi:hypothetical protein